MLKEAVGHKSKQRNFKTGASGLVLCLLATIPSQKYTTSKPLASGQTNCNHFRAFGQAIASSFVAKIQTPKTSAVSTSRTMVDDQQACRRLQEMPNAGFARTPEATGRGFA
ncbi:MAG TPA: hypothetical protein PLY87_13340, partial [Planctomycetaceae bacterium]|nr:hypothetical protein [Planctomycetaceae bacterium]